MRILLLSQWCFPEPDARIHGLANGLIERGHQVTIITGFPNYPYGHIYPGYRQSLWQREEHNGIEIIRLPLFPDHSRSAIRRTLTYLTFALSALIFGPFFSGKADVAWVYHPPLTIGIPAIWISMLRRIPFIYEIQDMWPETVQASGMLNAKWPIILLGQFARIVYTRAAAITVISNGFKSNLVSKGVPPDKVTVIPNWADETLYRPVERDQDLGKLYRLTGHFNVVFAGAMGPAQGLHTVIDTAQILQKVTDIQFIFIGDGIDLPKLKAKTTSRNLTNVQFIERQPAEKMAHFYAWGDVLLVQLRNDPLFHMTIPSKTLAYMASGRMIICAVPGDGADVIREADAGLICTPDDPQSLADAILEAYNMSADERDAKGTAGRQTFLARFTRRKLIDEYERIINSVTKSNPR